MSTNAPVYGLLASLSSRSEIKPPEGLTLSDTALIKTEYCPTPRKCRNNPMEATMATIDVEAHDVITIVIQYLYNHRFQATVALFPMAKESYRAEWLMRDPAQFWCHLDSVRRAMLVEVAIAVHDYPPSG